MPFGQMVHDAETLLRAYREKVAPALGAFAGSQEVRLRDGAPSFERICKAHKCILRVAIVPFHPAEGAYADVALSPYRVITGGARRETATIRMRGKPMPGGDVLWIAHVERHTDQTDAARRLIRRFRDIERLKDIEPEQVAPERLRLLADYARHGPQSLV